MNTKKILFFLYISSWLVGASGYNIGLMVMATGKYVQFVEPLIRSADKHFCTNHNVYYFIFTDGQPPQHPRLVRVEQKRLGWPHDTMMRFSVYYSSRELLSKMDYLFATDADMLFVGDIGDEILSERVGTLHPGYFGTPGTPERNTRSTACVKPHESNRYFCGGFYGGQIQEVLKLLETTSKNIQKDLDRGIIAVWHDESHINRYFVDNPPTKVLSPSYCFVERYQKNWDQPYPAKLVALDKNHAELRK